MCVGTKCVVLGCRCHQQCNCEQRCFACRDATRFSSCGAGGYRSYETPSCDIRNKYVCFPCRRVWKSSVSKYQVNDVTNYMRLRHLHSKETMRTLTTEELSRTPVRWNSRFHDLENAYTNKQSACAKCGCGGIHVGRNFRHCRTDKEWRQLQEQVDEGKVNLVSDFHDYPRELRT